MSGGLPGTNETSVFDVEPRAADDFPLPDTGDGDDPYDVRGADRITVLVDNGADEDVDVELETYAFNDEEADTEYPVDDSTTSVSADETGEISVDVAALAFVRVLATYGTGPSDGTLTVTYQSDRQG